MPRKIEMMPVEDLVPAERNPKAHDAEVLNGSLDRFGFIDPIVRDDRTGRLVSGHGRTEGILARMKRGDPPPEGVEVDAAGRWVVPVVTGWASANDDEAEAAGIALNRIGERGSWDEEALAGLLSNLENGPGLAGLGYDQDDLDDLFARLQEDGGPEPSPDGIMQPDPYQVPDQFGAGGDPGKQSRSMVFDFLLDDFRYLATVCEAIRTEEHLDSNSQVFAWLLAEREGVNA